MTIEDKIAAHVAQTQAQATHRADGSFWNSPLPVLAVGQLSPLPMPVVSTHVPTDYLVKQRRIRTRKVRS